MIGGLQRNAAMIRFSSGKEPIKAFDFWNSVISGEESKFISDFNHLTHMTSISSMFKIIKNAEFHASHYSFLNDPLDCIGLFEDLREYVRSEIKSNIDDFNLILNVEDVIGEKRSKVIFGIEDLIHEIDDKEKLKEISTDVMLYIIYSCFVSNIDIFLNGKSVEYYILSMSINDDGSRFYKENLHVMNMYADKGRGVIMKMPYKELKNTIKANKPEGSILFKNEVLYYTEGYVRKLHGFLKRKVEKIKMTVNFSNLHDKLIENQDLFENILRMGTYHKRDYYKEEREFRFIFSQMNQKYTDYKDVGNGRMIPYLSIGACEPTGAFAKPDDLIVSEDQNVGAFFWVKNNKKDKCLFRSDLLLEIIVGPSCDDSTLRCLDLFKSSTGLNFSIQRTKISYRS